MTIERLGPRFHAWVRESAVRTGVCVAVATPLTMSLFFLVYFGPDRPSMPLLDITVMLIVLGAISGFWVYKRTKHLYPMRPPVEDPEYPDGVPTPTSQMLGHLSDRFLFWVMAAAGLSSIMSAVGFVTGLHSYGRWSEVVGFAVSALMLKAVAGERRRRHTAPFNAGTGG
jgi:hypothetical protein